eukprot:jgi/Picre1/27061/NNA_000031.t1
MKKPPVGDIQRGNVQGKAIHVRVGERTGTNRTNLHSHIREKTSRLLMVAAVALASSFSLSAHSMEGIRIEPGVEAKEQYFQTVPQGLEASDDSSKEKSPRLSSYLQGPKGKEIQQCTRRCTSTCIRGGQGAPGLGPMAVRKEVVVFKEGYRSGKYCLSECLQICALQINGKK